MVIPKKARIRSTVYAVKSVHSFRPAGKRGEIHYANKEIKIAKFIHSAVLQKFLAISKEEQWEVFWHEIVHGILNDMKRHDLNNERFVNAFCLRLYGVLRGEA